MSSKTLFILVIIHYYSQPVIQNEGAPGSCCTFSLRSLSSLRILYVCFFLIRLYKKYPVNVILSTFCGQIVENMVISGVFNLINVPYPHGLHRILQVEIIFGVINNGLCYGSFLW